MLPVRVLIDMGGLQGRKAILVKMQARRNKKRGEEEEGVRPEYNTGWGVVGEVQA